jgi:hypothetical protein
MRQSKNYNWRRLAQPPQTQGLFVARAPVRQCASPPLGDGAQLAQQEPLPRRVGNAGRIGTPDWRTIGACRPIAPDKLVSPQSPNGDAT